MERQKKYQVICNPENYEIAADKKVQEEKEQKHKTELAENSNYYEVCGKDKGRGTCIDNVFTRKIIGGTQVSYAVGNALVKEYMRVKGYNGVKDEITCGGDNYDKNIRKETIVGMRAEYYIKCKSLKDATKYYEFKFDDLEESKNLTANTSVYNAVWHIIYDYQLAKNSHNGYDTKTKTNCDAVDATFKKICNGCGTEWRESGYIETKGKKFCYDKIFIPNDDCKTSPNDLNTAFDIDPFVFCKNTHNQLKNTGSMESLLKQYISDNLTQYIAEHKELAGKFGYSKYNIECYPQTLCYSGSGCGGVIGHGDDIKTCVVHGDKDYTVDFVFDDVNEFSKKLNKGALQSMACVVSKGTFTGQECIVANKEQCDALIRSTSQICPECKKAKWNPTTKLCELPDAKTVTQLEKGKTIAMIVGGSVVAVGVTVATVGSGAPVVVIVLSGLEVVGGGIELGTQIHIDGMAHDFLLESVKCQDASCAERLIKENMQSLANITNDMQDYEINAVDEEFARLLKLIPEDSAFYQRIVENGATLEDNKKGFFDPEGWNQAQVWRAIGIGLQFSSLTTGVIKKLIEAPRFANKFPKLSATLTKRVKTGKQITTVSKVDDAADAARGRKIANADSPESEAGFEAMMQRVAESNDRKITPEEIQAEYVRRQTESGGKYTSADIEERIGNYKEYYEAHGNGTLDTQTKYRTADGSYTAERQQIHDKILDDLFKDADKAKPAAGEKPTFVMLGGRGGSGKSSLKGLAYDPEKTVVIDADKIKTMLPEYSELFQQQSKYAGLNAWEVHEESSDIVKAALDMAKERGINVVLDGTMSSAGSALKKITPFENAGYRIEGAYMYLPREESTVRGMGRGMNLDYSDVGSGRFVPTDVLLDMKDNEKAFGEVSGHFDSWGIWTTEGVKKGEVPNLIGHSEDIGVFERGDDFQKLNNTDIDLTTFGK